MALKFVDNSKAVIKKLGLLEEQALAVAATQVLAKAVRTAPVDTGNLRNSLEKQISLNSKTELEAYIGTNVEYAPYVELGTSNQDANPFLTNAFKNSSREVQEIVKRILGGMND